MGEEGGRDSMLVCLDTASQEIVQEYIMLRDSLPELPHRLGWPSIIRGQNGRHQRIPKNNLPELLHRR